MANKRYRLVWEYMRCLCLRVFSLIQKFISRHVSKNVDYLSEKKIKNENKLPPIY